LPRAFFCVETSRNSPLGAHRAQSENKPRQNIVWSITWHQSGSETIIGAPLFVEKAARSSGAHSTQKLTPKPGRAAPNPRWTAGIPRSDPSRTQYARGFDVALQRGNLPSQKRRHWKCLRLCKLRTDPLAMVKMAGLTGQHIAQYRDRRLAGNAEQKPVSGSTVNRELTLIGHLISVARKEWGIHIDAKPISMMRRPKENRARCRRLNPGEEERLAERLDNILELSAVTGHKTVQMLRRCYHPRATDLAKKLG
jgi:hypothetical protein